MSKLLVSSGCFTDGSEAAISLQGVVTYMSHVEVFATVIKIESSESKSFLRANQGIKVTSELQKSKDQEFAAPI